MSAIQKREPTLAQELRSLLGKEAPKRQSSIIAHVKRDLGPVLTELFDSVIKKEAEKEAGWRKELDLFKKSFVVKRHCGAKFDELVKKAEGLSLYDQWQCQLILNEPLFEQDTVQSALKLKDFLYTVKDLFFRGYFSDAAHTRMALQACIELYQKTLSPEELVQTVVEKKQRMKVRIQDIESQLLGRIGRVSDYASSALRFITNNHYVQSANHIVESRERALQNFPSLQTPREGPYLAMEKVATAAVHLGRDIALWGLIGTPYSFLNSVSQAVMPGADRWMSALDYLNVDEKTTLQLLPAIHHIVEAAVFVGMNCLLSGWSMQTVGESAIAYVAASAVRQSIAKAVDLMYKDPKAAPTHAFVSMSVQSIAFSLIHAKLVPYLMNALHREPPALSRHEALARLNIAEGASAHEIGSAFRKLAAKYHPDKNPTGQETYINLIIARDFLLR